ncbi:hypothetical protein E5163_05585 [Marinicauda algicola]|uniref:Anti-sigma factor NepR domain-containing protein n=1 Tax=Marinicauda algicola TaxID=2029849 RepID=A0A4S2H596_9PROT|nr:NepR family anti-sigma factor [Marinicauda algicola]TGY90591.1 hypothetical protein E5163_05585 [Marinicauda algicola]
MASRPKQAGKAASPRPSGSDEADELGAFGRQLRRLYQDTVNEPIPESFRDLLDQLEADEEGGTDEPGR